MIRTELKAIGITSKQVSVKSGSCGYSEQINVSIKDLTVNEQTVKNIAEQYEEYERDERSGEILEGGNTYILVDFDYDTKRAAAQEMLEKAKQILEEGKTLRTFEGKAIIENGNFLVTYFPGDHEIRLTEFEDVTDEEGTFRDNHTRSRHCAYNEHDIASALGFWKYQYKLAI